MGLDVVRRSIESLKGTIKVETTSGKGSVFELLFPPTMAIVDVMIVRINNKRLAIPISSIVEVANFKKDAMHRIGKGDVTLIRDEVLQILWLNEMVRGFRSLRDPHWSFNTRERKCCVPVDAVEGKQEVVVKPLSSFIGTTKGISGVTIRPSGPETRHVGNQPSGEFRLRLQYESCRSGIPAGAVGLTSPAKTRREGNAWRGFKRARVLSCRKLERVLKEHNFTRAVNWKGFSKGHEFSLCRKLERVFKRDGALRAANWKGL